MDFPVCCKSRLREQSVKFVVTEIRRYNSEAAPREVFASSSGTHLNLITCEGEWDYQRNTYTERLVVFTDKQLTP